MLSIEWGPDLQRRLSGSLNSFRDDSLPHVTFFDKPSQWFSQREESKNVLIKAFSDAAGVSIKLKTKDELTLFISGSGGLVQTDPSIDVIVTNPSNYDFEKTEFGFCFGLFSCSPETSTVSQSEAILESYHNHHLSRPDQPGFLTSVRIVSGQFVGNVGEVALPLGDAPSFLSPYKAFYYIERPENDLLLKSREISEEISSFVGKRISRRLFVVSGECSESVYSMLSGKEYDAGELGLFSEGDFDSVDLEGVLKTGAGPVVLCLSPTSLVDVLARVKSQISSDSILRHWNSHWANVFMPKICGECKIPYRTDFSRQEDAFQISKKDTVFAKGHGCDHCFQGYQGVAAIEESTSSARGDVTKFMSTLVEIEKEFSKEGYAPPFKVIEKIRENGAFKTVLGIALEKIQHGEIQLSDLKGTLV